MKNFNHFLKNNNKLFESEFLNNLNESENYKPKLSSKKTLANYKLVKMNNLDYVLLEEVGPTNKDKFVIKFNYSDSNMKSSIADLLNPDADSYEWWSFDTVFNALSEIEINEMKQNNADVFYLLENFDALLK